MDVQLEKQKYILTPLKWTALVGKHFKHSEYPCFSAICEPKNTFE